MTVMAAGLTMFDIAHLGKTASLMSEGSMSPII